MGEFVTCGEIERIMSGKQLHHVRSRVGDKLSEKFVMKDGDDRAPYWEWFLGSGLNGDECFVLPEKDEEVLYFGFEYGEDCHHRVYVVRSVSDGLVAASPGAFLVPVAGPAVGLSGLQLELRERGLEHRYLAMRCGFLKDGEVCFDRVKLRLLGQGYDLHWWTMHGEAMFGTVPMMDVSDVDSSDCVACVRGNMFDCAFERFDLGDGLCMM